MLPIRRCASPSAGRGTVEGEVWGRGTTAQTRPSPGILYRFPGAAAIYINISRPGPPRYTYELSLADTCAHHTHPWPSPSDKSLGMLAIRRCASPIPGRRTVEGD